MSNVKLSLKSQSVPEKIEFATRVGGALVENEATFPEPPVAGADLQDLATALQEALVNVESARATLRVNLILQRAAEEAVDAALTNDGQYVQTVSGGDAAIIALAAIGVSQGRNRRGPVKAPEALEARTGASAGEIVLRWTPVADAMSYVTQVRLNPELSAWHLAGGSSKAKTSVKKLTSGQKYFFRVAAIGTAGQGNWSAEASSFAP
jgi:hypothetical protein